MRGLHHLKSCLEAALLQAAARTGCPHALAGQLSLCLFLCLHVRSLHLGRISPVATSANTWLLQGIAPAEALPFYSDIIWDCMELLAPRLDIEQREAFCKVCSPYFVSSGPAQQLSLGM